MAQMSTITRDRLNKLNPEFQRAQVGTTLYEASQYSPVIFRKEIAAAANSTALAAFTAPFAMRIVDIIVEATATVSGGTVTPKKGTTAMCAAIACAADKAVTHMSAGAVVAALELAAGDVVNLSTVNAGDRGIVTFIGVRL